MAVFLPRFLRTSSGFLSGRMFLYTLFITACKLLLVISHQNAPGYLGCYIDCYDSPCYRALPIGPGQSNSQSVEWCFEYCLDTLTANTKYAGLEYEHECYCGSNEDYGRFGKRVESECQDSCRGNPYQICGARSRISIYSISDGVCSNDVGPPTHGTHVITNPPSVSYNLNNFKFFRTRVDFSCDPGYTLHGASSIECIETADNSVTWSDSVPTCEEVHATTTAHLGTASDSPMTNTNDSNTGALQTGTIVGIAFGAAILTAQLVIVILLCIKRRKQKQNESDVAMATVGDSYANVLPHTVSRSITDQSTMHAYDYVIRDGD